MPQPTMNDFLIFGEFVIVKVGLSPDLIEETKERILQLQIPRAEYTEAIAKVSKTGYGYRITAEDLNTENWKTTFIDQVNEGYAADAIRDSEDYGVDFTKRDTGWHAENIIACLSAQDLKSIESCKGLPTMELQLYNGRWSLHTKYIQAEDIALENLPALGGIVRDVERAVTRSTLVNL